MVFYLCNGKKCDCSKTNCCYTSNEEEVCFHTTNPDFALYGPLKEGSVIISNAKDKERPLFVQDDQGDFWEGFVGCGRPSKDISNKEGK